VYTAFLQGSANSPASAPRHLLKPLDQPLALEARQSLDPEHAVQLIDLMLVADGAETFRLLGL
jgi:hypothetical protein